MSIESCETKSIEVMAAALGCDPHMGRPMTGWTVGMLCAGERSDEGGRGQLGRSSEAGFERL